MLKSFEYKSGKITNKLIMGLEDMEEKENHET